MYLTLEALPGQATIARLQAALAAARFASVRLTAPSASDGLDPKAVEPLVKLIQGHGAAAIIGKDAALALSLGADGVHLSGETGLEEAYVAARETLGADRIVGVEIVASRHDAMSLGEMGADYIAFDGPERDEHARWWSEVFVVPCVALGVSSAEDALAAAATGAEFVGLSLPGAGAVADVEELVRTISAALAGSSPAHSVAS